MARGPSYERAASEEHSGLYMNGGFDDRTGSPHSRELGLDGLHPVTVAERRRLWWRNAVINSVFIASWFFFATLLSVYNKWMFSTAYFGFTWPLFVTTLHMFVQFVLAALVRTLWPKHFRPEHDPTRADYGRKVVPTAVTTCLDIGLSNLSLKAISLSFYTMCKSSSLIFVLCFAFLFRLEIYSLRLVGVILLIFLGVLMMVATETHFVLSGFVLVISASALGGLRWSLTQLLLKERKMGLDNPAATVFWLAPVMGVTLAAISAAVEGWAAVLSSPFFAGPQQTLRTCFFLVAPGTLAFCMVMSEFYIIQRVGVVPMSIAGIAKEVTTISISAWLFGDDLTPLNIVGVTITIAGITLFTYHKYQKSVDPAAPPGAHLGAGMDDYSPADRSLELEERERLANGEARFNQVENVATAASSPHILFAVEDDEEESDGEAPRSRRENGPSVGKDVMGGPRTQALPAVARESLDVERIWRDFESPSPTQ